MSRFMDRRFSGLKSYVPGEQPRDKKYVKLNTNESPFPPSPKVIEAINSREMEQLRLYPDPEMSGLTDALAKNFGVTKDMVFVGNGSDEVLNFAFMAFCGKDRGVAYPEISYGFYRVYSDLYGLDRLEVPLKEDFSIDPKDYYCPGRTVVIANPNAPTGLTLNREQIVGILESDRDRVVLIDEAYVDFGSESCVDLTKNYDNLLVVQTFSKSRSLAGARLGFAIGNKELIGDLNKIKFSTNPFNIDRLTALAGIAAIEDREYFQKNLQNIIRIREATTAALKERGFETLPSSTNFVFTKKPGISGRTLYEQLRKRGVLVRHFPIPAIEDRIRVTIGDSEDMRQFILAIDNILKEV